MADQKYKGTNWDLPEWDDRLNHSDVSVEFAEKLTLNNLSIIVPEFVTNRYRRQYLGSKLNLNAIHRNLVMHRIVGQVGYEQGNVCAHIWFKFDPDLIRIIKDQKLFYHETCRELTFFVKRIHNIRSSIVTRLDYDVKQQDIYTNCFIDRISPFTVRLWYNPLAHDTLMEQLVHGEFAEPFDSSDYDGWKPEEAKAKYTDLNGGDPTTLYRDFIDHHINAGGIVHKPDNPLPYIKDEYQFIEDRKLFEYLVRSSYVHLTKMQKAKLFDEYATKVMQLNSVYRSQLNGRQEIMYEVFEKYNEIVKEYFDVTMSEYSKKNLRPFIVNVDMRFIKTDAWYELNRYKY